MNVTIELTGAERRLVESALADYASRRSPFVKDATLKLLAAIGRQAAAGRDARDADIGRTCGCGNATRGADRLCETCRDGIDACTSEFKKR